MPFMLNGAPVFRERAWTERRGKELLLILTQPWPYHKQGLFTKIVGYVERPSVRAYLFPLLST